MLGRHHDETAYETLCFLHKRIWKWGLDGYILKYEPYTTLHPHKDPVENGKHYRLNIEFGGKGSFICQKTIFNFKDKIILFRPDKETHSVINGSKKRYVLSIGFVKYK
jgi:hypothetical protein